MDVLGQLLIAQSIPGHSDHFMRKPPKFSKLFLFNTTISSIHRIINNSIDTGMMFYVNIGATKSVVRYVTLKSFSHKQIPTLSLCSAKLRFEDVVK